MAYFIRIGGQRKGRHGSRGWHVWIEGRRIIVEFGPVEVLRNRRGPTYWWSAVTQRIPSKPFTSAEAAKQERRRRIEDRIGPKGYQRLPSSMIIHVKADKGAVEPDRAPLKSTAPRKRAKQ
jgi:hypothetical protein